MQTQARAQTQAQARQQQGQGQGQQGQELPFMSPWPVPPVAPLITSPASVELWQEHVDASLAWLRAHDAGVRALPSLVANTSLQGVGILIEPRDHADAEFVLRNWAHFRARQGWGLVVVHGSTLASAQFYASLTRGWPNVLLLDCGAENLDGNAYNSKLTDPDFWKQFICFKRVVVFQTDTAQIASASLARFCEYDWVGAPWAHTCLVCNAVIVPPPRKDSEDSKDSDEGKKDKKRVCCGHMIDHRALQALAPNLVGNGGLSLRNPRAMLDVCERFRLSAGVAKDADTRIVLDATNEDTFFCLALQASGRRIAPRVVADEWAIEQVVPRMLDPSLPAAVGIHKPWAYVAPDVLRCILASVCYKDLETDATFYPTRAPQ